MNNVTIGCKIRITTDEHLLKLAGFSITKNHAGKIFEVTHISNASWAYVNNGYAYPPNTYEVVTDYDAEIDVITCHDCDKQIDDEDEQFTDAAGETVCEDCYSENNFTCEHCEALTANDDAESHDDHFYCRPCFDRFFVSCNHCGEYVNENNAYSMADGNSICESCYQDNYFTCDECDEIYNSNNATSNDNGTYCEDCAPNNDCDCTECQNERRSNTRTRSGYINNIRNSDTFIMNKHARFVGVELEHISESIPAGLEVFGQWHDDGSLSTNEGETGEGHEFVTYPANGDTLFNNISKVCEVLNNHDAFVNNTCGMHVHVDARDLTNVQKENVYNNFRLFESTFFAMVQRSRRGNDFCKNIKNETFEEALRLGNRYRSLNLQSLSKHGTLEFRLHGGSLNETKIQHWITLLLNFVETFKDIRIDEASLNEAMYMTHREKLVLLFQMVAMPLTLKKYIVERIKKFDVQESSVFMPRHEKAKNVYNQQILNVRTLRTETSI